MREYSYRKGRQAGAEIDVTREMAIAGEEIVGEYDGKFVTAMEIAIRVYRQMESVRRLQTAQNQPPVGPDAARLAHWRQCYGDLWKCKVAFEKQHNG